ncbi:MAG: OmpA family protein, partial [bacterium]|nr:OmpA family protein [Candidatus Kapabacteria bacterium]
FKEDDLHAHSTLGIYHQMLNIVGKRLQANPKARIKIVGCTSGEQGEKGNFELASRRAEMVRDFFRDTWQIDPSRMSIQPRGMPERASSEADPDGAEENRRVEIVADTWSILEPVNTADTARAVSPSKVRFETEAGSDAGLTSWHLTATQSGKQLKKFEGKSGPPEKIEWDLQREPKTIPLGSGTMDYTLSVTDGNGQTYATPLASIPVDQITIQKKRFERIADKEINRYSLILFDYGSAELDESNRRIIDQIRSRIKPTADVRITGYTDRIGDEALNAELSAARAREAQQALGVKTTKVSGEGEAPELHDNSLPEGRFYCRTVQIVAETPIVQE